MIFEALQFISVAVIGLLVGSLLTEATILVPFWRKMEPQEFLRLHGTMGPSLYHYFAPLTVLGSVIPIITGIYSIVLTPSLSLSAVVALLTGLMLCIYFIYFKAANESFESGSVGVEGVAKELRRWAAWHWLRVVIGLIAFLLSIAAFK